jgi:hypothetical protein
VRKTLNLVFSNYGQFPKLDVAGRIALINRQRPRDDCALNRAKAVQILKRICTLDDFPPNGTLKKIFTATNDSVRCGSVGALAIKMINTLLWYSQLALPATIHT